MGNLNQIQTNGRIGLKLLKKRWRYYILIYKE